MESPEEGTVKRQEEGHRSPERVKLTAVIESLLYGVPGEKVAAKAGNIGVSRNTVYRWKNGERPFKQPFESLLDAAGASGSYRDWCLAVWLAAAEPQLPPTADPTSADSPSMAASSTTLNLSSARTFEFDQENRQRSSSLTSVQPTDPPPAAPEPDERPPAAAFSGAGASRSEVPALGSSPDRPLHVKAEVELGKRTLRQLLRSKPVVIPSLVAIVAVGAAAAVLSGHDLIRTASGASKIRPTASASPNSSTAPSASPTKSESRSTESLPPARQRSTASPHATSDPTPTNPLPPPPVSTPPARATTCHWQITWPKAGVYSQPTQDQTLKLKTKPQGKRVGPYCETATGADGKSYLKVQTDAASDGIGWMRFDAVTRVE